LCRKINRHVSIIILFLILQGTFRGLQDGRQTKRANAWRVARVDENKKGAENRRLQRLAANLEAECLANGLCFQVAVLDISSGGMRFEAFERLEKGQEAKFLLNLPDTTPLKIKGEIRWREKFKLKWQYGVLFKEMADEDASALRHMIQQIFWENFNG